MTIAITADLHFHPFPEFSRIVIEPKSGLPINSRLLDQLLVFRKLCTKARALGATTLIVAGDIFHQRGKINVDVYNFVYSELKWARDEMGLNLVLLTGNHDQMDDSGMVHSLFGLQDIATVVDTCLNLEIEGTSINFVPFMNNRSDLLHCFDRGDANGDVDILIAHCGVDGAVVGPVEFHIKDPITIDQLHPEQYTWVLLAHYHSPQSLNGNSMYIGSPWQIDRAERNEIKRFFILDPKTMNLKTIRTGAKRFRTMSASEFILLSEGSQDDYYDVIMDGFAHVDEVHATTERLGFTQVKLVNTNKAGVSKARSSLSEDMSDQDLLMAYLNHKKAEPALLTSGLTLLSAVSGTVSRSKLTLERVVIDNFMGIERADLKLDRPGSVIAVLGINESEGYKSNGAAKSTLLPESIFWCFFDQTARDLPADKVVNRRKKRNCRVTVYLQVDNHKLSVTRYRKHEKLGGTGLKLVLDGVPVTLGTPRLTDERLAKILGIDFVTFSSVVAFSPDTLRFVSSTDANQKHVLDSILQTRRFSIAQQAAKLAEKDLRGSRTEISLSLGRTQTQLDQYTANLEEYCTLNKQFEQREQERVYSLQLRLDTAKKEVELVTTSIEQQSQKLTLASENVKAAKAKLPDITALTNALSTNSRDLGQVQGELKTVRTNIDVVQKKLDTVNNQVGKPCPKCGQDIPNIGKLIASYQRERSEFEKAERLLVTREVSLTERYTVLNQEFEAHKLALSQIESLKKSEESLSRGKATLQGTLNTHKLTVAGLTKGMAAVPHNDYPDLISKAELKVTEATHIIADAEQALAAAESELKECTFWIEAFGNSGIRSFLLDQILPDLTEYANDFSSRLTGGSIAIEFKTYTEGATRDKFQILAKNDEGSDIYAGDSSGEKRRIDVCVMLALFRIAHNRTKINVMLLDETLDSLDTAGLDNVVGLLESLAKELELTIFVTSHTELNARLHESITLVKHGGLSHLRT